MKSLQGPLTAQEILDTSFLENRARVLEIAAFLDRIERAEGAVEAKKDFRYRALCRAVELLLGTDEARARDILLSLSDHSPEPIESAAGMKSAVGAWKGAYDEHH